MGLLNLADRRPRFTWQYSLGRVRKKKKRGCKTALFFGPLGGKEEWKRFISTYLFCLEEKGKKGNTGNVHFFPCGEPDGKRPFYEQWGGGKGEKKKKGKKSAADQLLAKWLSRRGRGTSGRSCLCLLLMAEGEGKKAREVTTLWSALTKGRGKTRMFFWRISYFRCGWEGGKEKEKWG